jgi:hypothetical protein
MNFFDKVQITAHLFQRQTILALYIDELRVVNLQASYYVFSLQIKAENRKSIKFSLEDMRLKI